MILVGVTVRKARGDPGLLWFLVFGLVGAITLLRAVALVSYFQLSMLYAVMVGTNYAITFVAAALFYKDPARDTHTESIDRWLSYNPQYCVYVIPVFREPEFIIRCVQSVINAATYARMYNIHTSIVVVNDASPDNTWEVLQQFSDNPYVHLVNLVKNVGKKEALTIGMCGGVTWRDAFSLFKKRNRRMPGRHDYKELIEYLKESGCSPLFADYYFHTDSDSIVTEEFIYRSTVAYQSDPKIGAVSGHCDVWLDPNTNPRLLTSLQVAWYFTQFRIRKAAESVFGSVFCVSGPGASFRARAIMPTLLSWVDDKYNGRIYRGATDRKVTYEILKQKWKVVYSASARTYTVVPETFVEARSQWTRWKQNFWRMLGPVSSIAWKMHPAIVFLTYSRLIVTIIAPVIMIDHLIAIMLGNLTASFLYLAGLMLMGSIMGVAYVIYNPRQWRYGLLRPLISLLSAFWGSSLTLRAFYLDRKGAFTWREAQKNQLQKGRIINRWWETTFESRLFTYVFLVVFIIWLIRLILSL